MPTSSQPRSLSEWASIIEFPGPKRVAGLFSALALLFGSIAWAGTSTLTAQASVNTNCQVAAASVAFGAYDPITTNSPGGANLNATGSITITCVKGTAPTIGLDLGANFLGSTRRMRSGITANYLTYELFKPPTNAAGTACTFPGATVWGTAGVNLFSPTAAPNKTARIYNICGTVAAGLDPAIGIYSDSVVATITF